MKPIPFKEQTNVAAETQDEYGDLPFLDMKGKTGTIVSCWELSEEEIAEVVKTGKIWVGLMCFGNPLTPSLLTVNKTDLFETTTIPCTSCGINDVEGIVNMVEDNLVNEKECKDCDSVK